LPKDVEVDEIVTVDQSVSKSDDLRPRYFRIRLAVFFRRPACGLADYFEESDQREVQLAIRVQIRRFFP
jgi:hypothetical protein